MFKMTVDVVDFNGVKRTEDHYFNLTKAEILEMEMSTHGGMAEMIKAIVAAQDGPAIVKIFRDLVLQAYGQKSPDGRRFIKNDQIREEFKDTQAYSEIFMMLATDADKAAEFVNGIMPADIDRSSIPQLVK